MPLRHQPPSLQKASMTSIARNFDYICYGAKTRRDMCNMIHDESYQAVEGPFVRMPLGAVEGVMESLREEGRVRRHHLHQLILPHLTDFSYTGVGDVCYALEVLRERCRNLRRLDLSYLRNVSPGQLISLVPNLTRITSLNLTMTQTIDQMVGLLGEHCPQLRDLNLTNTPITDAALPRLCYNSDTNQPQCQKLTRVTLDGCSVAPRAVAFLVQYLPALTHLDYDHIFHVFGVLEEWGATPDIAPSCDKYQLRVLTSTSEQVDPATIDLAVTLCPFVLEMTVSNAWLENSALYPAMRLDHLAHLRLTNCDGLTITFQEGVLPLLTLRGEGLLSLLLANFATVDVSAIGECCPRLQNLALSNVAFYEDIMYPRDNHFNSLVNLEVWTDVMVESCSSTILRQLLTFSPGLQNLLVKGADALSDKLLLDLWKSNPMRELSRLTLNTCHNVTSATIHDLLDATNNLTLIRIWGCFFITKSDFHELQKRIAEENCDTYIEWYSWGG